MSERWHCLKQEEELRVGEIAVKMSKRKGLSFEEKRVRLKELFTETVCAQHVSREVSFSDCMCG